MDLGEAVDSGMTLAEEGIAEFGEEAECPTCLRRGRI